MKIASVDLKFGKHASSDIDLPRTGVVLITGANGQGKSSIVEGVAHAIWDDSIRKKSMWGAERAGKTKPHVEVKLYDEQGNVSESVVRTAKTRGTLLDFSMPWGTRESYENQPKAQEALEDYLGSFDVWRKTSVFSSSDVSSFTTSPDADRKKLIESILGLERLDAAYDSALKDQRVCERATQAARADLDRVEYAIASKRRAVENAEARAAEAAPARPLAELEAELEAANERLRVATEAYEATSVAAEAADARVRAAARTVARLRDRHAAAEGGACATCGTVQPGDPAAQAACAKDLAAAEDALTAVEQELDAANTTLSDRSDVRRQRKLEARAASDAAVEARAHAKVLAGAASVLLDARTALEDELDKLDEAKAALVKAERAEAVAVAVAKVLSTKGVRAHILGGALSAVEDVANTWLTKVASTTRDLELKLSVYVESAKGTTRDALGLEVLGAGGGNGYLGASSGERRRIDVALMLALAEVAEYAHGVTPGTLFFDEVFDALDDEGVAAVCDVIEELGTTRCVVVITHNQTLAAGIGNAAARYEAIGGKLVSKP